jgi:hypothetical protein
MSHIGKEQEKHLTSGERLKMQKLGLRIYAKQWSLVAYTEAAMITLMKTTL